MFLEQRRHDVERLTGAAAAFQAEPDEVHAEQTDRLARRLRPDRLIPDDDTALVDAVLEAPEPERLTAEESVRVSHLRYRQVLTAHRRSRGPVAGGIDPQVLAL